MRKQLGAASLLVASGAFLSGGCAVQTDPFEVDAKQQEQIEKRPATSPAYSVKLESGSTLEFFEPEDGIVTISESGSSNIAPLNMELLRGKKIVEIFTMLVPNQPIPDVLVELGARIDQQMAATAQETADTGAHSLQEESAENDEVHVNPDRDDGVLPKFSASYFQDNYCPSPGGGGGLCSNYGYCWTTSSGNYQRTWNNIHNAWTMIDVYRGDLNFKMRKRNPFAWKTTHDNRVEEGHWRQYEQYKICEIGPECTACFGWDTRIEVYNASGDGYHLSASVIDVPGSSH